MILSLALVVGHLVLFSLFFTCQWIVVQVCAMLMTLFSPTMHGAAKIHKIVNMDDFFCHFSFQQGDGVVEERKVGEKPPTMGVANALYSGAPHPPLVLPLPKYVHCTK